MFSGTKGYRTKLPAGVRLNPLHPLSQGLVGCWLFNEGAGSVANDISGHGNHGMLKNMAPNAQGSGWGGSKFGGALKFDGVNDYVEVASTSDFDIAQGTLEFWVKRNNYDGLTNEHIFEVVQILNQDYFRFYLMANGRIRVYAEDDNAVVTDIYTSTFETADTNWHHLIVTQDGTGITFYIDGVEITDTTVNQDSTHLFEYLMTWNMWIGKTNSDKGNVSIDSVRIYNRALSAEEVKTLYLDPFCNLLRVPVRYVPAAPEIIELLTTISATTSTSAPNVLMLRELISTIPAVTLVSSSDVNILRELISTIATTTLLSEIELITATLRELVTIVATTTSTSSVDITVLRELVASIDATTSLSDIELVVSALRELAATIATSTSTSAVTSTILRELATTVAAATTTLDAKVAVLREVVATVATTTSTSTSDLNILRELISTIAVTTLLSDIELLTEQLRELVTTIATVTSTSTPEMKVLRELEAIIEATTALSAIELAISVWLTSNPTITRLKSEGWFE